MGQAIRIFLAKTPGLVMQFLARRIEVCKTQGDADCAVSELVDIGSTEALAVAVGIGIDGAVGIGFQASVQHHLAAVNGERTQGPHVDGARQPLAHQRCIAGLVDDGRIDQLGRELIELDRAVITGGDLRTAIEQGPGKVRRQAADLDHLSAAGHPLSRQTWQTSQRLGNADVRQLADVLGRNRLDDRIRIALGCNRCLNAARNARDGHRVEHIGCLLRLGSARCEQEHGACGRDRMDLKCLLATGWFAQLD